jgi:4-hydroxy-tetrahydrodipicolinate synthase
VAREIAERCEQVVALKEANADPQRVREVVEVSGLAVFCGEDASMADFMQYGAHGAVSVVGNLMPREVVQLLDAARPGGDSSRAAVLVERMAPLIRDLFVEVNPVPLKAALALTTSCHEDVRLPLVGLEAASRARLRSSLLASGVIRRLGAGSA